MIFDCIYVLLLHYPFICWWKFKLFSFVYLFFLLFLFFSSVQWLRSVQFSRSIMSDSLGPHESQHTRLPCPSPSPRVDSNSRPSTQWCHPAISSSIVLFSSCFQSFPASGSFPKSILHIWWPKYWSFSFSIGPSNEHQDWSPLGCNGWISLQSKGLSRVFSNTTVQKHQFFNAQLSL